MQSDTPERSLNFYIAADTQYAIALIDDCDPATPGLTITNDAELVVRELLAKNLLDGHKRLIYLDAEGWWDEIVYGLDEKVSFSPIRVRSLAEALLVVRRPAGTL